MVKIADVPEELTNLFRGEIVSENYRRLEEPAASFFRVKMVKIVDVQEKRDWFKLSNMIDISEELAASFFMIELVKMTNEPCPARSASCARAGRNPVTAANNGFYFTSFICRT
jgi:hypothetical protein